METLTDIFIRRPVLAIVVNLVIIIAGLQAVRAQRAPVPAHRERDGHGAHRLRRRQRGLVRGFITTPLERAIAAADGIDYIESQSSQGLSTISVRLKLNFQRAERARGHQREGESGARRSAARGRDPAINIEPSDASSRRCT